MAISTITLVCTIITTIIAPIIVSVYKNSNRLALIEERLTTMRVELDADIRRGEAQDKTLTDIQLQVVSANTKLDILLKAEHLTVQKET